MSWDDAKKRIHQDAHGYLEPGLDLETVRGTAGIVVVHRARIVVGIDRGGRCIVPFAVGDKGAQFRTRPQARTGRNSRCKGDFGQAFGRAILLRDTVRTQFGNQLEVVGQCVHWAHADRGPDRRTSSVRLVFLPQGHEFHAEMVQRLDRHIIEHAGAFHVRTEQGAARGAKLAIAGATDARTDAVLHAEGVAAAPDFRLTMEGRQLPAIVALAQTIVVFTLAADEGAGDVQRTVHVHRNFTVDQVLAHGGLGTDSSLARDRVGEGIGDVVVLEEGVRQLAWTEVADTVQTSTGTVHVDVLGIQHMDVRTVVETLTDPGRTASQEVQALCFDVSLDDADLAVAEVGSRRKSVDPQSGHVGDVAGLGDGLGVTEFRVGIALIAEAIFRGVAAQAVAALWAAAVSGRAAGASAQVAVETFGVTWEHGVGSGRAPGEHERGQQGCLDWVFHIVSRSVGIDALAGKISWRQNVQSYAAQ